MRRLRDWEFESRLLQRRVGRTRIAFARLCTLLRQVKALLRRSAQTSSASAQSPGCLDSHLRTRRAFTFAQDARTGHPTPHNHRESGECRL